MKTKKVPIFLEFMKKSFFIISLILIIYTIGQLIAFWMFTDEYEMDLLKSRYNEIINLSQDINVQISESGFYEYLKHSGIRVAVLFNFDLEDKQKIYFFSRA